MTVMKVVDLIPHKNILDTKKIHTHLHTESNLNEWDNALN